MTDTNPRGGAAEARNPDFYCTATKSDGTGPCQNYRVKGQEVCRYHGASSPQALARVAADEISTTAAGLGIVVPPKMKPKDFGGIVAGFADYWTKEFAALSVELEDLKGQGTMVQHVREYSDLLDRLDKISGGITRLMDSAARLGLDNSEESEVPPAILLETILDDIRLRIVPTLTDCPTCGQHMPQEDLIGAVEYDLI